MTSSGGPPWLHRWCVFALFFALPCKLACYIQSTTPGNLRCVGSAPCHQGRQGASTMQVWYELGSSALSPLRSSPLLCGPGLAQRLAHALVPRPPVGVRAGGAAVPSRFAGAVEGGGVWGWSGHLGARHNAGIAALAVIARSMQPSSELFTMPTALSPASGAGSGARQRPTLAAQIGAAQVGAGAGCRRPGCL